MNDYVAGDNTAERRRGIAQGISNTFQRDPNKQDAYAEYMKGQAPNGFKGYGESLRQASEAIGMSAGMISGLAAGRPVQAPGAAAQPAQAPAPAAKLPATATTIQGQVPALSRAQDMALALQTLRQAGM